MGGSGVSERRVQALEGGLVGGGGGRGRLGGGLSSGEEGGWGSWRRVGH